MKKKCTFLSVILLLASIANAQYFQGSFSKDQGDAVNLKLAFKMRPTANLTTGISYMEAAFRYPTATTTPFTLTNITSNTATFPGLSMQRFLPDYVAAGYTYVKFVFNTGSVSSASYTSGTEYPIFTVTTSLPATAAPQFEMASNIVLGQYQFGVVNGAGVFLDPGAGAQLYGGGLVIQGNENIVPLNNTVLPVKFSSFNLLADDKGAKVSWTVANQDINTIYFDIERSVDGTNFQRAGTVGVNRSLGSNASYTFIDTDIMNDAVSTIVFYRIKQVDADGKFVFTEIKNININSRKSVVGVYPNPAAGNTLLSFTLNNASAVRVSITDILGHTVQNFQIKAQSGRNQAWLNTAHLPRGIFQITIHADQFKQTIKLVKL